MKIDLHLHTKNIAKGDTDKRVIKPSDFIEKMIAANIGVAAITNHNYFKNSEFEKFKSEEYLLLPGVEVDVEHEGRRKQLNYILGPDMGDKLETLVSTHLKNITSEAPIKYEKFIEYFDSESAIMYFDVKPGNTNWNFEKDIFMLRKHKYKSAVIFDASNAKTHAVMMAHQFNTLIGSDVMDWNKYIECDAPKLIDTSLNIKKYPFELLIKLFKYDPSIFSSINQNRIKNEELSKLELKDNEGEKIGTINNIEIYRGVNTIFGPKATGKTAILDAIKEKIPLNSIIYKSIKMKDEYESLMKPTSLTPEEKGDINELKKIIEDIKSFRENPFIHLPNFLNSLSTKKDKITIHTSLLTNVDTPIENTYIKDSLNHLDKYMKSLSELADKTIKEKLIENANVARTIIQKHLLNTIKKHRLYEFKKQVHIDIATILSTQKGSETTPIEIGLLNEWKQRNKILDSLQKLKTYSKNKIHEITSVNIPDRNKLDLIREFKTFPFDSEDITNTIWKQKTIYKKIKKIFKLTQNDSVKHMISCITKNIKDFKTEDNFLSNIKVSLKNESGKIYSPSNGEKAIILLSKILEEDKNIFLLDEPGVYLGSKMITETLLPRIAELKKANKTIIITTHQSSIGINSMPSNFIFRTNQTEGSYETYTGNFLEEHMSNVNDSTNKINFKTTIVENFEGGHKHFNFRKDIYEY